MFPEVAVIFTPEQTAELTGLAVTAFVTIASAVVAFVGRAAHGWVNANKNDKNFSFLMSVATMAVQAAEQIYGDDAEAKLDFATEYVKAELARRNIQVNVDQIRAQIEAAVLAEFNYARNVEPAADASQDTSVTSSPGTAPVTTVTTDVDINEDIV